MAYDFPAAPSNGQQYGPYTYNGYAWVGGNTGTGGGGGGGIPEAPVDEFVYGRGNVSWIQTIDEVTYASDQEGIDTELDAKSDVGHVHPIAEVTSLQTSLDGKAPTVHTHTTADVSGLDNALANKAPLNHTHASIAITDFSEAVDDRVSALIVPGTNINIAYNDAANTLTVNSTAAGVTDGDKGDIVVSGSGATWMLDSAVVTATAKTVLDDTSTAAMLTTLGAIAKAGDAMTGILSLNGTCTSNLHAVHKAYVDNNFASVAYVDGQVALKEPKITAGSAGQYWDGTKTWQPLPGGGGGTGDVVGPAVAIDEALVRFDGTTGKLVQASPVGPWATDAGEIYVNLQTAARKRLQLGADANDPLIQNSTTGGGHLRIRANGASTYMLSLEAASDRVVLSTSGTPTTYTESNSTLNAGGSLYLADGVTRIAGIGLIQHSADAAICFPGRPGTDELKRDFHITGAAARTTATTNLGGGNIRVRPGDGASGSAGAANGGTIYLDGGRGYGTGSHGRVVVGATYGWLNLPHITAAASPLNGDVWTTTTGLYARINGATVGPMAPLASPTFTGDPKAPTPSPGDNDTSVATTAFVTAALAAASGGGGALTDGDKGDIVVAGAGTSWLFDSTVVTAAAKTVLDDATVGAMVTTLGAEPALPAGGTTSNFLRGDKTWQAVPAAGQPADATLTALAGLDASVGLVEQTAVDVFTKRAMGVGASTSVPTRADADARYAATVHTHVQADVTNLVTDLAAKAPLASPALTGIPSAPTAAPATNTAQLATTAFVTAAITAGGTNYAPIASPAFTGNPTAPTPTQGDADTSIATTAFVSTAIAGFAPIASPTFTGDPKAPTPATVDNDTSIATTAYVKAQGYAVGTNTVTAGAGLTGGGAISGSTTFDVGAGTGITVSADTVALTVPVSVANGGTGTSTGISAPEQAALDLKANIASPTFTGAPAAPTAVGGTNTTQLATTAFVTTAVAAVPTVDAYTKVQSDARYEPIDSAYTKAEDDARFAPLAHTHAQADVTSLVTDLAAKAPLASPTFTGTPAAPTATPGTNTTQLATTAFVAAAMGGASGGASVSDTAPGSPTNGQFWFRSTDGKLFLFFIDAGGPPGQWVQVNN